jgi:hypothetical protein
MIEFCKMEIIHYEKNFIATTGTDLHMCILGLKSTNWPKFGLEI